MEGLEAAYKETHQVQFIGAATRARQWLWTMQRCNGTLMRCNTAGDSALYTARASALIGDKQGLAFWMPTIGWPDCWGERQRSHYIAYAVEGFLRAGEVQAAELILEKMQSAMVDGLMPFWVNNRWQAAGGLDYCATIQFAILYHQAGMEVTNLDMIKGMVTDNGGIAQSPDDPRQIAWAAKYYLDLCKEWEEVKK
jgi:hypothetical protein